jgi:hypothetical protein
VLGEFPCCDFFFVLDHGDHSPEPLHLDASGKFGDVLIWHVGELSDSGGDGDHFSTAPCGLLLPGLIESGGDELFGHRCKIEGIIVC